MLILLGLSVIVLRLGNIGKNICLDHTFMYNKQPKVLFSMLTNNLTRYNINIFYDLAGASVITVAILINY